MDNTDRALNLAAMLRACKGRVQGYKTRRRLTALKGGAA